MRGRQPIPVTPELVAIMIYLSISEAYKAVQCKATVPTASYSSKLPGESWPANWLQIINLVRIILSRNRLGSQGRVLLSNGPSGSLSPRYKASDTVTCVHARGVSLTQRRHSPCLTPPLPAIPRPLPVALIAVCSSCLCDTAHGNASPHRVAATHLHYSDLR